MMTPEKMRALAKLLRDLAVDSVCRSISKAGCGDPECCATLAYREANELEEQARVAEDAAEQAEYERAVAAADKRHAEFMAAN